MTLCESCGSEFNSGVGRQPAKVARCGICEIVGRIGLNPVKDVSNKSPVVKSGHQDRFEAKPGRRGGRR